MLEQNRLERNVLKEEILVGKKIDDIEVLVEQLIASLRIKEKYNLMPLFREISFLHDEELQKILAEHRFYEITWLKNRFYDIYGEDGKPYYYECAIIFFGTFQYISFYWNLATKTTIDIKKVVYRSIKYVESFLPEMIEIGEILLEPNDMYLLEMDSAYKPITNDQIQKKLELFYKKISTVELQQKSTELTTLLLDEMSREKPRISVLELIIQPFRSSFSDTIYKYEAEEIANLCWLYMKSPNKA